MGVGYCNPAAKLHPQIGYRRFTPARDRCPGSADVLVGTRLRPAHRGQVPAPVTLDAVILIHPRQQGTGRTASESPPGSGFLCPRRRGWTNNQAKRRAGGSASCVPRLTGVAAKRPGVDGIEPVDLWTVWLARDCSDRAGSSASCVPRLAGVAAKRPGVDSCRLFLIRESSNSSYGGGWSERKHRLPVLTPPARSDCT